jgi:hypothetical protein
VKIGPTLLMSHTWRCMGSSSKKQFLLLVVQVGMYLLIPIFHRQSNTDALCAFQGYDISDNF